MSYPTWVCQDFTVTGFIQFLLVQWSLYVNVNSRFLLIHVRMTHFEWDHHSHSLAYCCMVSNKCFRQNLLGSPMVLWVLFIMRVDG